MRKIEQTNSKIIIEFDLLDFDSLQEFFKEQKEAVDSTGKFEYDAIKKFSAIELENTSYINDIRLKRLDEIFERNKKLLKEDKAKNR